MLICAFYTILRNYGMYMQNSKARTKPADTIIASSMQILTKRTIGNPCLPVDMYQFVHTSVHEPLIWMLSGTKVIRQYARVLRRLGAISTPLAHHARTRPVTLKPYTCWDPIVETRISPQTLESVGTIIMLFPLPILGNWGKTCGDAMWSCSLSPSKYPWLSADRTGTLESLE